jgi:DNA polymerase-3 subunit delta'
VGKQHLALWLGRLLLCRTPGEQGPCEGCADCRLANKIEHPDLHWYFPLPRPEGSSSPEKLADALEEARWERLKEVRARPLRPTVSGESRAIYLAAARTLRRQAHRRPSMATHQVFVIAEAEALAVQESSSEAANALLKLLEEPPADTTLILTSGEPGRLLPTIRSRTSQLHLPPLSTEEVAAFLVQVGGVGEEEARGLAQLSQGSIGRALGFRADGEGSGPLEEARREALGLLSAALAPGAASAFQASLGFRARRARDLLELLDFVEEVLRDLALVASGAAAPLWAGEDGNRLREMTARWSIHPTHAAEALRRVEEARTLAAGNVNPQLFLFGLLVDLRRALGGGAGRTSSEE